MNKCHVTVAAIAALVAFGLLAPIAPHMGPNRFSPISAAQAAPAAPKGEVILSLSGKNSAGEVLDLKYDLAALQALPVVQFDTTTPWTDGKRSFQGVSLKALLQAHNITSGTLSATAINDYRIEIPIAEFEDGAPIIAYFLDGAAMSVRDKGPLWVVYPYDKDTKYQSEVVYSRSIWQLGRLEIAP